MENSDNQQNKDKEEKIKGRIMDVIKSGRVVMKPKWRFVAQAVLWFLGCIAVSAAILYLISLIIFTLRISGLWFAPQFGMRGIMELLAFFPWLILLAAAAFIFVLEIFVRRWSIAWRFPLLYSAIAVLCLAVMGGLVVAQTPLHRKLRQPSGQPPLPPPLRHMKFFYEGIENDRRDSVTAGVVVNLNENELTINDKNGANIQIIISNSTRLPRFKSLEIGDAIAVFGKQAGGFISAEGIIIISNKDLLMKYFIHEQSINS